MLQVESCIELYCYTGCILSSKKMPRSTNRSPPASGAPRGSPARQASRPAPLPKPGNAPARQQPFMVYPVISFSCLPNKLD